PRAGRRSGPDPHAFDLDTTDANFRMTPPRCRVYLGVPDGRCPPFVRKWRNWQTRKPQELVAARSWRFESSLPHQLTYSPIWRECRVVLLAEGLAGASPA